MLSGDILTCKAARNSFLQTLQLQEQLRGCALSGYLDASPPAL